MIKYLGSKRRLVPALVAAVEALPEIGRAADLFTGTTRVAQAFRESGCAVACSDLSSYSKVLATAYVVADRHPDRLSRVAEMIDDLNGRPGFEGYVTETFSRNARYFQPENAMKIDAIRDAIDEIADDEIDHALLLTSLLEAADRVDSTVGLQMAYLKQWSPRSFQPLQLRPVLPVDGPSGRAFQCDAAELLAHAGPVDLAYLDPPYNQHSYRGNYHVWETIVRNDKPEHYGIACKRVDCRTERSLYNSKPQSWTVFSNLVRSLSAVPWLVVSFSNEGFHAPDEIIELLAEDRFVAACGVPTRRHVGSRIGIHDHRGKLVGSVSHTMNSEYIFIAGPDPEIAQLAADAASAMVSPSSVR